jgi:flagellar protein FliT
VIASGTEIMQSNSAIEQIWHLTKAIEQAAAVGEWQSAALIADQRSPLLMSLSMQQSEAALATLRAVHAIDAAVLDNARTAQNELGTEYRAAMRATQQAGQYQSVARF